ncbi:hypothetical protein [Chitinophaga vietnamensis]|uniref:hypothetical protein n=1 Tax=Chitinophaga vietnamensis TaxID=2593957 RepID=UPI0011A8EC96|nr:hypothetical protein [Chitinophaga vietnamensis]
MFICNLCFIAGEILRITAYDHSWDTLVNHVLVLGVGIAFPVNLLLSIIVAVLLLLKKITWRALPPWVYLSNLAILVFELIVSF